MCASVAPDLFRIADDDSEVVVLQPNIPDELVSDALNAELCCPVEAITVNTD
jgi:ferredoxin